MALLVRPGYVLLHRGSPRHHRRNLPLLAVAAGGVFFHEDFQSFGATSVAWTYPGDWGGKTIPSGWTTTPNSFNGQSPLTANRQPYTADSGGHDAGVHGAYTLRAQPVLDPSRSVAVPAGASGRPLTFGLWVRYIGTAGSGANGNSGAKITFGSYTASDPVGANPFTGSGNNVWQYFTLVVPGTHGYAGTSQTLTISGQPYQANNTTKTEFADLVGSY